VVRLEILGATQLTSSADSSIDDVLSHPKRLALLAYLACARPRGFHRRAVLHALFWPEQDERHARWSLNQTIKHLRSSLGDNVIASRGRDALAVSEKTLWCDAAAMDAAVAEQDWATVYSLYCGELLPGLHVAGCHEFDDWLEAERMRLRRAAARASFEYAKQLAGRGARQEAAHVLSAALSLSRDDAVLTEKAIAEMHEIGDGVAALRAYQDYVEWLRGDLGIEPPPSLKILLHRLTPAQSAEPMGAARRDDGAENISDPSIIEAKVAVAPTRKSLRSRFVVAAALTVALAIGLTTPRSETDTRSNIDSQRV
jgi:DNA-binding SARP family transcriptional activator